MNGLIEQFGANQTAGFMLVLGRIGPMFLLAPLFSSRSLPMRARGIAAVALAVGFAPLAVAGRQIPLDTLQFGSLMLKEILVGLAYAFVVASLFAAVSAAGSLLDTLVGFSFGSLIDPLTGTQSAVLQQAYVMFATMVFIAIGGDRLMVFGLARTYDTVPLLAFPSMTTLTAGVTHAFAGILASALAVAAPVVIALVITDAAFGAVSRVVPTLNVFAVGFPAKIATGLLLVGATLPFAAGWIADQVHVSVGSAFHTIAPAR
jgi:flagellar biosynthetic protein FliR